MPEPRKYHIKGMAGSGNIPGLKCKRRKKKKKFL